MARYVTTVRSPMSAEAAFAYMADLRNFAEWDPGVTRVEQVEGDGGGADGVFDVTVGGMGRPMTLRYRTEEFAPSTSLLVVARTSTLSSVDRVTVAPDGDGCTVTYDADLRLSGPLALFDPLLRLVFGRIGDRAAAGLRRALDGTEVV